MNIALILDEVHIFLAVDGDLADLIQLMRVQIFDPCEFEILESFVFHLAILQIIFFTSLVIIANLESNVNRLGNVFILR